MPFVQDFLARFKNGAKPNKFEVQLTLPAALQGNIVGAVEAENKFSFFCRATDIPASSIGQVQVFYKGAPMKFPGDRTFDDWTVTVINDSDYLIRNAFEQWSDMIVGQVQHDRFGSTNTPTDFFGNGVIRQLDMNDSVLATYDIVGVWPTQISGIPLDFQSQDTIEEFQVILAYQWFENRNSRNNSTAQQATIRNNNSF